MGDHIESSLPRGMSLLGWGGVLPFLLAVLVAWGLPQRAELAAAVFVSYGAVILSFLGGARWGRALAADVGPGRYVEAVLPGLVGFSALLMVHVAWIALLLLATGFAVWLVIDQRDPLWSRAYKRMRFGISIVVLMLHAAWILI